jgi:hypothetical protein
MPANFRLLSLPFLSDEQINPLTVQTASNVKWLADVEVLQTAIEHLIGAPPVSGTGNIKNPIQSYPVPKPISRKRPSEGVVGLRTVVISLPQGPRSSLPMFAAYIGSGKSWP